MVPVMWPKVALLLAFAFGWSKCGVLVTLNASARNSRPTRSVTGNLLNIAASRLKKRGPANLYRLIFPRVCTAETVVNAEGSNHRLAVGCPGTLGPMAPRTRKGPTWFGV